MRPALLLMLAAGPALAGNYSLTGTAAPSSVTPGQTLTLTATVTDAVPENDLVVDMEVHQGGTKVDQHFLTGQTLGPTATTYTWAYTVPAAASGAYTLSLGVFSANFAANLGWVDNAAAWTVTAAPTDLTVACLPSSAVGLPLGGTGGVALARANTTGWAVYWTCPGAGAYQSYYGTWAELPADWGSTLAGWLSSPGTLAAKITAIPATPGDYSALDPLLADMRSAEPPAAAVTVAPNGSLSSRVTYLYDASTKSSTPNGRATVGQGCHCETLQVGQYCSVAGLSDPTTNAVLPTGTVALCH